MANIKLKKTRVKKSKSKRIKIKTVEAKDVHVCPEFEEFKFAKKCPIKTCQFWTSKTERRCLALDRRESSKGITDAELSFYKCPDLDARQVFNERRKSIARVEAIIILSEFIQYIIEHKKPLDTSGVELSPKLETLLDSYPLNGGNLGFSLWMLPYIVDETTYRDFLNAEMNNRVDVINLNSLLDLTPRKFSSILHETNKLRLQ